MATTLDRLWAAHAFWTRQTITSTLANLPDAPTATARLLRNQRDIGAALAGRYGMGFGTRVAQLLTEHIQISLPLVKAAAAGDAGEVERQWIAWHRNADEMAALLASVNPAWAGMRAMLYEHLKLTFEEAAARIAGNWTADVSAFDAVLEQAFEMAETMQARFG